MYNAVMTNIAEPAHDQELVQQGLNLVDRAQFFIMLAAPVFLATTIFSTNSHFNSEAAVDASPLRGLSIVLIVFVPFLATAWHFGLRQLLAFRRDHRAAYYAGQK